ncbi:MAG: response regulator [Bacteroidetes bacterium]|nr:MAG: response regulator [Bacteroidota bacterium]
MTNQKHSFKILLVDDEPNILLALDFLMSQQGYQVARASSGEEALQLLPDYKPDLVILDVMMPGMDGFEVAMKIRTSEESNDLSIIFLTAKGTAEDKLKGYGSGGEVYVTKPFDNDDLVRTVNEIFEHK